MNTSNDDSKTSAIALAKTPKTEPTVAATEPKSANESAMKNALAGINTVLAHDADDDEAAAFVLRWKAFKAMVKEIDTAMHAAVLDRLLVTGRDLTVGEVRYYAGDDKDTVCTDVKATTDKVLIATKGDVGQFSETLVSQPYKSSACRLLLSDEDYAHCFTTRIKGKVKEGKPKLCSSNPKFLK